MATAPATANLTHNEVVSEVPTPASLDPTAQLAASAPHAAAYATQANSIDPYFYEHYVLMESGAWSTSQLPGTILAIYKCHPESMHSGIAYLSKLYNAWSGGFQIGVEIAGTGFNGGKLGLAKIPPNIDPYKLTTVNNTFFPYTLMDPKAQGISGFPLHDQKNMEYHYLTDTDDSSYGSIQSFGGWLVVFVYQKLVLASDGQQDIAVNYSSRLGPDFQYYQIIDPTLRQRQPAPVAIPIPQAYGHPYLNLQLTKMFTTELSAVTGTGTYCLAPFENAQTFRQETFSAWLDGTITPSQNNVKFHKLNKSVMDKLGSIAGKEPALFGVDSTAGIHSGFVNTVSMNNPDVGVIALKDQFTKASHAMAINYTTRTFIHMATGGGNNKLYARNNERIVFFQLFNDSGPTGQCAPRSFIEYAASGVLKQLSENESIIIEVVSKLVEQPVLYMRWNPEGFFTVPANTPATTLNISDVELVYYSRSSTSTPMPPGSKLALLMHKFGSS